MCLLLTDDAKSLIRRQLLEKRNGIPAGQRKDAGRRIFRNIGAIAEFQSAESIAFYHAAGSEVPTVPAIMEAAERGAEVLLPRTHGDEISFHQVRRLEDLRPGRFGIMEPGSQAAASDKMDAIIVPAIGAGRDGHRLGYGRGYYDKFLKRTRAVSIVPVYSSQLLDTVPHNSLDVRADWIVTENETIKIT